MNSSDSPQEEAKPFALKSVHGFRVRKWVIRTCISIGLLVSILAIVHRPLLVGFALLFRIDNPAPSDAIVVLNGQWMIRPLRAAELYRQRIAPVVLLGSTKPIPYPDLSESALNRAVLIRAGVPPEAIKVLPGEIESTQEEALRVKEYLQSHPAKRITVVTHPFHTTRSRWIFRKVLQDANLDVRMAAASDPRFDESNWYKKGIGRDCYLAEAVKLVYYRLRY